MRCAVVGGGGRWWDVVGGGMGCGVRSGNFDIIFDQCSRISQLYPPPTHAVQHDLPPMVNRRGWVLAIRRCVRFAAVGHRQPVRPGQGPDDRRRKRVNYFQSLPPYPPLSLSRFICCYPPTRTPIHLRHTRVLPCCARAKQIKGHSHPTICAVHPVHLRRSTHNQAPRVRLPKPPCSRCRPCCLPPPSPNRW